MTTLSEHTHTRTPQDTDETIVVFRTWKDTGDVIALFPGLNYESGDANFGHCMSFEHVGQHGEADYEGVVAATRPATEQEYEDFAAELEDLGYRLKIVRKKPINL